jgi:hypothetical protein
MIRKTPLTKDICRRLERRFRANYGFSDEAESGHEQCHGWRLEGIPQEEEDREEQ